MIIKVCGLREAGNIRAVEAAGADWFGFIFYPRSPRYVDVPPAYLPGRGKRVGVFVNAVPEEVGCRVAQFGLQAVQLHGEASPGLCRTFRRQGLTVIRALPATGSVAEEAAPYQGAVDFFLFDTPTPQFGGSGQPYDWSVLRRYQGPAPFLLSGGISLRSLPALHAFRHPLCAGFDLNSGFETAPAVKDAAAVRQFILHIKPPSMNRLKALFNDKPKGILSVYFCAGHPRIDSTMDTLRALQQGGADMAEIGIPFSDPLADGPVIQAASAQALKNGMSVCTLFGQLRDVRSEIRIPLILMGYLNPILHFGFERFCAACQEVGVDGLIIPDLPFDCFYAEFAETARRYGLEVIFLVTPETPEERIRLIDARSEAFVYAVSSASVTGEQQSFSDAKRAYFRRLEAMRLRNPLLVGFGISNRVTRAAADAHTAGVIVGSKFVSLLDRCDTPAQAVARLIEDLGRDARSPSAPDR